jgi:hypothetical protein
MLNHENSHCAYFEELCALAAIGQISETEFVQLRNHLAQCAHCRSTCTDYTDIVHNKLPLAEPELISSSRLPPVFSENSSYRGRFLARARKEGIPVSQRPSFVTVWERWRANFWTPTDYRAIATVAVAALLVVAGLLGYNLHETNVQYRRLATDQAALNKQLDLHREQGRVSRQNPVESLALPHETLPPAITNVPRPENEAELIQLRAARSAAQTRSKALEARLEEVASELEVLRTQNAETRVSREELEKKVKEAERVANNAKEDLQEIRQARSKDSVTIAAQNLEIQKLSERLTVQAELLDQEKNLLEASRDVRDLMGSRNFHIADVYDVDSKGKDQRAFGRVFYTEGKSTLIFYAFDLNDRNATKRNASFQVWGKGGPAQGPTLSLGLFQIDDQKQNRWVLRFEDPQILAKIDSVFVTVEPPGGSSKPTGRQFLFAYLNTNGH